ncbi:MAG: serine/threonine protein kinase [Planctomycetes bacterium]|nr:serine/threonine protein kinase [Planctomycetota bacterium]
MSLKTNGTGEANLPERRLIEIAWEQALEFGNQSLSTVEPSETGSASVQLPLNSFSGYEILREINHGGQGVIYQGIQKATGRKVAIKVIREGSYGGFRERARFEREIQILGLLNHPNIVNIHDSGQVDGLLYYVMEYIPGQPLQTHMTSRQHSIEETLRLFAKICEAVHEAHLRGVIHRDLKPGNIQIDVQGEPHILDFGLAKFASTPFVLLPGNEGPDGAPQLLTETGQFLGSLPWVSPEQVECNPDRIDLRSDVYSLGVILFQMLTGEFPYPVGGNAREILENILKSEPVRPRSLRREIDGELETIVLKCLRKERERRYQTVGELARDIGRYLAGEPIDAKRDSLWYVLEKALICQRYRLAAMVIVVSLLGFAAFLWTRAHRLAEEQDHERLVALIQADWLSDTPEVAELYRDFLARLRTGETDEKERKLFLSNAVRLELIAREIAGLDFDFSGEMSASGRVPEVFNDSGIEACVDAVYMLGGRPIEPHRWTYSGSHDVKTIKHCGPMNLNDHFPGLDFPAELEFKAVASVGFYLHEAMVEFRNKPGQRWNVDSSLWKEERVLMRHILVLQTLPENYPPVATDEWTSRAVEAAFRPVVLWVGPGVLGLQHSYLHGIVPLAGKIQILDPLTGLAVGEVLEFISDSRSKEITVFPGWKSSLSPEFVASFEKGVVQEARVRIVPDQSVALLNPGINIYYGRVLETTVPLGDEAQRK